VFADDGCQTQANTLGSAFAKNRFRFVHGIQITTATVGGRVSAITGVRLLAKANPTSLRWIRWPRFRSPIEIAQPTASIAPPPSPRMIVYEGGCDARAVNGFFDSWIGRGVRASMLVIARTDVPRIGMSLRLWVAEDGCACIAIAHNHFPKYEVYLDGILLRLSDQHLPDFRRFDPYQLDVKWRNFIVMQLYAMLGGFPVFERYPGVFLTGWYESVATNGTIKWCANARGLLRLSFPPDRPAPFRFHWWRCVELFVLTLRPLERAEESLRDSDNSLLQILWREIADGVEALSPVASE
jgi:hypothetical protein